MTELVSADKMHKKENIKELDALTIKDIEAYGTDIQVSINETMSGILKQSRVIDMGQAGERLKELAEVSKSSKKTLALKGPLATLSRITGKYEKLESQMDQLEKNVDDTVNKLQLTLYNLEMNNEALTNYVTTLKEKEEALSVYASVLEERRDPDQARLQVTVRRLKDITTTRMMAEQNRIASAMNLQENKEATRQIADIKMNIIPIIKMQLINKVSSKIVSEAMEVKKSIYGYTNELMQMSAEDLDKTAEDLIEARTTSAYDIANFDKACGMMIKTIEKVAQSANTETQKNKEIIRRMQETAMRMNGLLNEQFIDGCIEEGV